MAKKRDYIEEILAKKQRHYAHADREKQFRQRVIPLVSGFRTLKSLKRAIRFRDEWLKYGAIGYIACIEGYFKMLFADLIDHGPPYSENTKGFKDINFKLDAIVAIHAKKVSLGEFISHLLPIKSVSSINHHMSILIDRDFLDLFNNEPVSEFSPKPFKELFPETVGELEELFRLRHLFCHELATKAKVPVRKIESGIGAAAGFVIHTEEIISKHYLKT
jgi:hypothetical protein